MQGLQSSEREIDVAALWSPIFPVDITPLAEWLGDGSSKSWGETVSPTKPQRIHLPPANLIEPIAAKVFGAFEARVSIGSPMLSRMKPGQSHPMHVDTMRSDWITRVHVPITTNPGCWMMFEAEGERVHFDAGMAYTFNAVERHAFGNDGETDRVHLIFDVLRS